MTPIEIVKAAVAVLDEKQARDIQVLQIEELTTLADYFIICTGTSNTHIRTLTEHVDHVLDEQGVTDWYITEYECEEKYTQLGGAKACIDALKKMGL